MSLRLLAFHLSSTVDCVWRKFVSSPSGSESVWSSSGIRLSILFYLSLFFLMKVAFYSNTPVGSWKTPYSICSLNIPTDWLCCRILSGEADASPKVLVTFFANLFVALPTDLSFDWWPETSLFFTVLFLTVLLSDWSPWLDVSNLFSVLDIASSTFRVPILPIVFAVICVSVFLLASGCALWSFSLRLAWTLSRLFFGRHARCWV